MKLFKMLLVCACLSLFAVPALADPVSSCDASFSTCNVYENSLLVYPFCCGFSGDVILLDADSTVSDVFRVFNDFIDTGGGTGLGFDAFLYSKDEGNLPNPATYSVNAVFIAESLVIQPSGLTDTVYNGNGTIYHFLSSPTPEPASWGLLATAILAAGGVARKRFRKTA